MRTGSRLLAGSGPPSDRFPIHPKTFRQRSTIDLAPGGFGDQKYRIHPENLRREDRSSG